jgi:hypothetical protein
MMAFIGLAHRGDGVAVSPTCHTTFPVGHHGWRPQVCRLGSKPLLGWLCSIVVSIVSHRGGNVNGSSEPWREGNALVRGGALGRRGLGFDKRGHCEGGEGEDDKAEEDVLMGHDLTFQ